MYATTSNGKRILMGMQKISLSQFIREWLTERAPLFALLISTAALFVAVFK